MIGCDCRRVTNIEHMSGQNEWSNAKKADEKKPRKSKTYEVFSCMAER